MRTEGRGQVWKIVWSSLLWAGVWCRPAGAIELRWVGQDGHDLVGAHPGPAGNDFQDVHLVLRGLPTRRKIVHAVIRGHGADEWATDKPRGTDLIVIVRQPPQNTSADLYIEPFRVETGRSFEIHVKLDDGQDLVTYTQGGKADPNRRLKGAGPSALWDGPIAVDRVGRSAAVGPDGVEDVRVRLANLSGRSPVRSVTVLARSGTGSATAEQVWCSGLNPAGHRNAEFRAEASDPTRGEVLLGFEGPTPSLQVEARVEHEDGRVETATTTARPGPAPRAMPHPPLPSLRVDTLRVHWVGQEKSGEGGEVSLVVEGLEPGRKPREVALTDGVVGCWATRSGGQVAFGLEDAASGPLRVDPTPDQPRAFRLSFPPCRDEAGATLTLRVRDDSGGDHLATFPGETADVRRVGPPGPRAGTVTARPGDDLQNLVDRHGTVRLVAGTYRLTRPLVLHQSTHLEGVAGSVIRFEQPADAAPWTSAIKIHRSRTCLEQFAVRFAGPIRWDREVSYGPAVVGTTDNRDPHQVDRKHAIDLLRLDLEAPPAASAPPAPWEPAPNLMRLNTASDGRVEGNTLRGGSVVFEGGPWSVVENRYLGTQPHTFCYDVFAAKYSHDLNLSRNRVEVQAPSGKTWRFLVLAQRGARDVVANNVVSGIGAREDDPIPHPNAPEVILTESYRLHFEGKPAAISPGGRAVVIPEPQGNPAVQVGDVVAILAGREAGQWRTVAMVLGPRTYLLDAPIDPTTPALSIATGFVHETFQNNVVDVSGSGQASAFVLAGNHFGVQVANNQFRGGAESIRLIATATEEPGGWGWSHAPVLGATLTGNVFEDAARGVVGIEQSRYVKSTAGRVYLSAGLRGNVVRRTSRARSADPIGPALWVGADAAVDPSSAQVVEHGTRWEGLAADRAVRVHARVNGSVVRNAPLSPSP